MSGKERFSCENMKKCVGHMGQSGGPITVHTKIGAANNDVPTPYPVWRKPAL